MSAGEEKRCRSSLFKEPLWLGFKHDGYPPVAFSEYRSIRSVPFTRGREEAAVLQSWLTFGLIEAVIERHVPENSLIKMTEGGRLVMSVDKLSGILQEWIDHILGETETERLADWSKRVHTSLNQAHSMIISLLGSNVFSYATAVSDDMPATICLMGIIGEALTSAKMAFPTSIPQQGFSWSIVWGASVRDTYQEEMVAMGWCPFTVHSLSSTLSLSSLGYASMIEPLDKDKKHDSCSTNHCKANMVDVKSYAPKHMLSDCDCERSVPSIKSIKGMLARNRVPLVAISDEKSENSIFRPAILEQSEAPYVAISHVWADGLGSSTENGLPTCQVRRLRSLTSRVSPDSAFWIDGLCIPESKEMRKLAIGLMAQTYSDAAAVLVLDKGLQMCPSTAPLEEKLLRVLVSGWMQRLWTLQEAVLAKKLVFLFSDALVPLDDLLPPTKEMPANPLKTDLAAEIFRLCKKSRYHQFTIGDIGRSLRWRATSKAEDETLAIASLLGVLPSILVNIPPEQRIVTLLLAVRELPSNILFLRGPKMDVYGFRWAPVSLMAAHRGSDGGVERSSAGVDAICTGQGLLSKYRALVFKPSTFEPSQVWSLEDAKQNRRYIVHDPQAQPGNYQCSMLLYSQPIPGGGATPCAAVLGSSRPPSRDQDGGFTVHCEYQRRLVIKNIPITGSLAEGAVAVRISGWLKVCVA